MSESTDQDKRRDEPPSKIDPTPSRDEAEAEAGADQESGSEDDPSGEPTHQGEDKPADEGAAEDQRNSMGALVGILGFLIALGLGFGLGQLFLDKDSPDVEIQEGQRYEVQLRGDEPQLGPDDALVTIIEFADYQCPYCAKAAGPLKAIVKKYDGDVRVIYKHFPLPMHRQATPAAKAGWAAHQQGQFWPMHEHLFATKGSLDAAMKKAQELGLDVDKFAADLESEAAAEAVDDDMKSGSMLGVRGTPAFVVNGHMYSGLKNTDQWDEIVQAELQAANELVDGGVARPQVYETLMKDAVSKRVEPSASAAPGRPDPSVTHPVPVDGRPSLGPDDALVTVVVFSDFQCPYCERIAPTVHQLADKHDDVRVVFRNLPIPSHTRARPAAAAALAAHRQGKFWEMHDKLFENRAALGSANLSDFAQELGLDVAQFEQDAKDPAIEQMIKEDEQVAKQLGISSTPSVYVNGRYVAGAQPVSAYDALISEERKKAQALVDQGTPRDQVYDKLMATAKGQ